MNQLQSWYFLNTSRITYIYYHRITMTRKSGKHLHVTYGALNNCFDLIRSHQQCTPWSPPLEIEPTTTVCRSRHSTTGSSVHATYKRSRINKSWQISRPLWLNVSRRVRIPLTEDTATSRATSSQVGVTKLHKIRPNKVETAVQCSVFHV